MRLREGLDGWEEDMEIMQISRESRHGGSARIPPTISGRGGNEEKESSISENGNSNVGIRNLVRNSQKQRTIEKRSSKTRF